MAKKAGKAGDNDGDKKKVTKKSAKKAVKKATKKKSVKKAAKKALKTVEAPPSHPTMSGIPVMIVVPAMIVPQSGTGTSAGIGTTTAAQQKHNRDVYREFWHEFRDKVRSQKNCSIKRVDPVNKYEHQAVCTEPHKDFCYCFRIGERFAKVELYIYMRTNQRKDVFYELKQQWDKIHKSFGTSLEWEPKNGVRSATIGYSLPDVDMLDENDRNQIFDFFIKNMPRLEKAIKPYLDKAISKYPSP